MILRSEAGVSSQELGEVVHVKLGRCHRHGLSSYGLGLCTFRE